LLSPFPVTDDRIFEEPVFFVGGSQAQKNMARNTLSQQEDRMSKQLALTPEVHRGESAQQQRRRRTRKNRSRPWTENSNLTKPLAFLAYAAFTKLRDPQTNDIPCSRLEEIMHGGWLLDEVVDGALQQKGRVFANLEDNSMPASHSTEPAAIRLKVLLQRPEFKSGIRNMQGDSVSLRAFLCLLCSGADESVIEDGMRWCGQFRAYEVLTNLVKMSCKDEQTATSSFGSPKGKQDEDPDMGTLTEDDVELLFTNLDVDGDGQIDIQNLCRTGIVEESEARKILKFGDKDGDGGLDKADLLGIARKMHSVVTEEFKAIFADHAHGLSSSDHAHENKAFISPAGGGRLARESNLQKEVRDDSGWKAPKYSVSTLPPVKGFHSTPRHGSATRGSSARGSATRGSARPQSSRR